MDCRLFLKPPQVHKFFWNEKSLFCSASSRRLDAKPLIVGKGVSITPHLKRDFYRITFFSPPHSYSKYLYSKLLNVNHLTITTRKYLRMFIVPWHANKSQKDKLYAFNSHGTVTAITARHHGTITTMLTKHVRQPRHTDSYRLRQPRHSSACHGRENNLGSWSDAE